MSQCHVDDIEIDDVGASDSVGKRTVGEVGLLVIALKQVGKT